MVNFRKFVSSKRKSTCESPSPALGNHYSAFHVRYFPVLGLHVNGIMQYVDFCDFFHLECFQGSSKAVVCISASLLYLLILAALKPTFICCGSRGLECMDSCTQAATQRLL